MLLVLDNFEHLLAAAAEVAELLSACPNLVMLATSRTPLRVRGEHEYPVQPLPVPDLNEPHLSGAVQLLVERVKAVSPGFELTPAIGTDVAAICRRLDGLPLAIELAAARLKVLSPVALLARFDRVLPVLTCGARDLPARQRTVRDTIGWSYDLIEAADRAVFRRLAVFAGGMSVEAIETIAGDLSLGETGVVDSLARLVDQSLVTTTRTVDDGDVRYRLLEPIREYARERLDDAGESDQVRARHAQVFLSFATTAEPELRGPRALAWLRRLETEQDNLRAALDWFLERGEIENAVRLAWALWIFWWARGYQAEGDQWVERMLVRRESLSVAGRGRALLLHGLLRFRLGGHEQPLRVLAEALPLLVEAEDRWSEALAIGVLGLAHVRGGGFERGERLVEESVALFRSVGDEWGVAQMQTYLGVIPFYRGNYEGARARFEAGLELAREVGNPQLLVIALYDVAIASHALGDVVRARLLYGEALRIAVEMKDAPYEGYILEGFAGIAGADGDGKRAARLYGASRALLESIGVPIYSRATDRVFLDRCLARARAGVDEEDWLAAWAEGAAMPPPVAIAYALEKV
jgi:predicted ATPase